MSRRAVPLDTLLGRWVDQQLITAAQADSIRAAEKPGLPVARVPVSVPAGPEQPSLVTEALGYLGGVLILIACALVTAQFWSDISTATRVTLAVTASLLLVVAGLALPRRGEGTADVVGRLVAVLLALGVAGVAASLALVGSEVLDLSGTDTGLLVTVGAALVGGVLWWLRPSLVQQAVTMVAVLATGAVATARLDGDSALPGVAVWAGGLAWLLLGWGEVLKPRQAVVVLGSCALLVGSVMTMGEDAGIALGLATTVALVLVAVLVRDLFVLAVAGVGAFLVLPTAVNTWFSGSLAAPLVLLLVGAVLIAAALRVARGRGRATRPRTERAYLRGNRRFGIVGAATVVAGAAVLIGVLSAAG